ncbi:SCP2 sterol-binding domain-containing protein [Micromonospora fulviviridis]|uniref:SCP2 sterol-binding domain-containing protein n=1 Tax=Micromonospora fulviviridis TaxID=47860 RepID=A0ABV2VY89_9ACTN
MHGAIGLSIRGDSTEGAVEEWQICLHEGTVTVRQGGERSDLVISADKAVFDRIARGETRVTSALYRNDIQIEGDMRLLMMVSRIFPGPRESVQRR